MDDAATRDSRVQDASVRDVLTFEHLAFLLKVGVSPSVLMAAIKRARAIGSSADRVLVTEGRITSEALYRALAGHVGVPFVETRFETDPCTPAEAVRSGLVRLVEGAPWRWLIAPEGERLAALVARCGSGMLPGLAITTPARLTAGMLRDRGPRMADFAANRLADANHYPCYRDAPSLTQLVLVLISIPVASYLLTWNLSGTATTALAACGVFLFVAICLRLAAIEASVSGQDPAAPPLQDHELPIYTVLVPLYREASVLPQIVTNLRAIDYPAAKLDIKLLIEAHDGQTRAAAAALNLDAPFEVLVCPPGEPRTKPRALNIGLRFARGEHVVVYDAEDRPEPSQLRLAAAAFHHADPSVACLQASLAIYNAEDGWLARMFALEYAVLFDIVLPGFARLNLPMPLGGTSNHFRTAMLERVLGWDPWNVTEDADLGLRFAEEGLCVGVLSSTTFEEAPFSAKAWMFQRIRWLKGWMQTTIAHSQLRRGASFRLGFIGFTAMFVHTYGIVVAALGFPIFVPVVLWDIASGAFLNPDGVLEASTRMLAGFVFVLGIASVVWPALRAARHRRLNLRVRDGLLLVPYFGLISIAAWGALWELIVAPSQWNKTTHGLTSLKAPEEVSPS